MLVASAKLKGMVNRDKGGRSYAARTVSRSGPDRAMSWVQRDPRHGRAVVTANSSTGSDR